MKISRSELESKYGISLPRGKYSIKAQYGSYTINRVIDDTEGCLLVGKNTTKGMVTESKTTFIMLMNKYLTPAKKRGESVNITIK